jgi:hypothetical protein
MTTFKDILYKKNDDETWAEWTKRVPDNDEDKLDYIGETIYAKIYDENKEKAGKITGMLLNLDVEELIVLLESNDLLEDKIKEEYQVLRELEEYKDITYKKNDDDETWSEWSKRVPDNNEDKLDYIGETIYAKICENDKEKAGKITGMLLVMGVEDLIPLLENEELLEDKIKEAYQVLCEDEEIKMSDEEVLSCDVESILKRKAWKVKMEEINELIKIYNEEGYPDEKEQENRYEEEDDDDDDDYKKPVITLTVAEMIEALSKLPPDAKLVMTESGFYSTSDFAEVMLPRPYKVENDRWDCDLPTGTQVYIIGHSHQSY